MKSDNSTDWIVKYKRLVPGSVDLEEHTVRANYVILGAGALGSTKILLRSKERGLRVSDGIGKRFSTNGDAVGFSYNGDKIANSVGVETKDISSVQPPGPTVTSIIDFRKVNGGNYEDNFIVEDGTPPSILAVPFTVGLSFGSKVSGIDKYPPNELLEKTFQVRNPMVKGWRLTGSLQKQCWAYFCTYIQNSFLVSFGVTVLMCFILYLEEI